MDRNKEMHALSSSSPSSTSTSAKYTILSPQNSNPLKFNLTTIPFKPLHPSPSHPLSNPISSHESSSPSLLQETAQKLPLQEDDKDEGLDIEVIEKIRTAKKSLEELLVVRRPVMEFYNEEERKGDSRNDNVEEEKLSSSSLSYDASLPKLAKRIPVLEEEEEPSSSSLSFDNLSKFAKKMSIFEPQRVKSVSGETPLKVNLDLALYRAKLLARNYQYEAVEKILQKVLI